MQKLVGGEAGKDKSGEPRMVANGPKKYQRKEEDKRKRRTQPETPVVAFLRPDGIRQQVDASAVLVSVPPKVDYR